MARINILDSKIYNKIAAGEIVERPSSVLKELLDNSLDAGSNDIKIEIKGGGLNSITVKDNGCGISKDDITNAFLPHATSKISNENDLFGIKTLGFRGEALASISSVSIVEIHSVETEGETGIYLKLEAGKPQKQEECATSKGTCISVKNLFYNTPARLKFIKSERAEETNIINITSRYILCNPNTRFKLTCNDKLIYQSTGQGLKEAINCVYGNNTLLNITEISAKIDKYNLSGYIGIPSFSKPNRTYQTLSLNKRYIINGTVSIAATNAYKEFLLKRQFPFYVLNLTMPEEKVDVNVHPNKMDVRFEDNKKIFSLFYNTIYDKLHSSMQSIVLCKDDKNNGNLDKTKDNNTQNTEYIQNIIDKYDSTKNIASPDNIICKDVYNEKKAIKDYNLSNNYDNFLLNKKNNINNKNENISNFIINNIEKYDKIENNIKQEQNNFYNDINLQYNTKCVLFNTYLVLEVDNNILVIDQHAAHERILYDEFLEAFSKKNNAIQKLIVPYLLNVNTNEYDFMYNIKGLLNNIGFEIDLFGDNVFKVSSVPFILSGINLDKYFNDLLSEINYFKQFDKATDFVKEELMKKACRAAVKAGDKLEKSEIDIIFKQLFNNKVLLCPHGRPIVKKYTKQDIEKLFKRKL